MKSFCKYLENGDIARFMSIFCQKIDAINVTFYYTSDKWEAEGGGG